MDQEKIEELRGEFFEYQAREFMERGRQIPDSYFLKWLEDSKGIDLDPYGGDHGTKLR